METSLRWDLALVGLVDIALLVKPIQCLSCALESSFDAWSWTMKHLQAQRSTRDRPGFRPQGRSVDVDQPIAYERRGTPLRPELEEVRHGRVYVSY